MSIRLLTIGDEILRGDITNTNAAWLGRELFEKGLACAVHETLPDQKQILVDAFKSIVSQQDTCIVTGGLGPTSDDLTLEALAEACGVELIVNETYLNQLKQKFENLGIAYHKNNDKQALVPITGEMLPNSKGTAPGIYLEHQGAHFFLTPGVPSEMKHLFKTSLLPRLSELYAGLVVKRHVFHCIFESESQLAGRIDLLELPTAITVGYRPGIPEIAISLVAQAKSVVDCDKSLKQAVPLVRNALGNKCYAENAASFPEAVAAQIALSGLSVCTAESCTGGLIASLLTDVAGSSKYFNQGYVTYSNQAKTDLLGVPAQLFEDVGAVSPEVVSAMAEGARKNSGADIAVAVSGIAGPGGGSDEKPVGLVHFALACSGKIVHKKKNFYGDRLRIKSLSAHYALELIRRFLAEE